MTGLRVLSLEHVPHEGPGLMAAYLQAHTHTLQRHPLHEQAQLPTSVSDWDVLIVMGGPMGVADTEAYPWLADEIRFIKKAIDAGRVVLGICLGAQLIARALGANVQQQDHREIGWYPITFSDEFLATRIGRGLANPLPVLHWHGDRFDLPAGSVPVASSEGCPTQGFLIDEQVLALQFHLEMGPAEIEAMLGPGGESLIADRFVQTADTLRQLATKHAPAAQHALVHVLDGLLNPSSV